MSIDLNNPTMRLFGSYKPKEQEEFKNAAKRLGAKVYFVTHDSDKEMVWASIAPPNWSKYQVYKVSFDEFIYFKHQCTPDDPIIFKFRRIYTNNSYRNGVLYGLRHDPNEWRFDIREEASGVFIDCCALKRNLLATHYHVTQINEEEYCFLLKKLEASEPETLKEIKEKIPIEEDTQKLIKYRVHVQELNKLCFILPNPIRSSGFHSFDLIEAQNMKNFAYYLYKDGYVSTSPRIKQKSYTEYPEYVVFYGE
jgi:hypothetical protein